MTVPCTTINKVCLSGLNAIYLADLMINAGDADIVVAGGMESMTNSPYLLPGARAGYRMGDAKLHRLHDRRRPVGRLRRGPMGAGTEHYTNGERDDHPGAPGRLRGRVPRAGGGRHQGRQASPTRSSR